MIKKTPSKAPFVKPKPKVQTSFKIKDEEAIEKFKLYLEAEKNSSDYTVISYIKDIEDFKDFLSSFELRLIRVGSSHIIGFSSNNCAKMVCKYLLPLTLNNIG